MEYRVISGDGHIDLMDLPHDIFTPSAPERLRDRVPHVEETNGERTLVRRGAGPDRRYADQPFR